MQQRPLLENRKALYTDCEEQGFETRVSKVGIPSLLGGRGKGLEPIKGEQAYRKP